RLLSSSMVSTCSGAILCSLAFLKQRATIGSIAGQIFSAQLAGIPTSGSVSIAYDLTLCRDTTTLRQVSLLRLGLLGGLVHLVADKAHVLHRGLVLHAVLYAPLLLTLHRHHTLCH